MKRFFLINLLSLLLISSWAQTDSLNTSFISHGNTDKPFPIITDRPDMTESAFIVPARSLQIETGIIYQNRQTDAINVDNWLLGTTLLRYGVWDNFELRLGSFYQQTSGTFKETSIDTTEQGFGPILAGFKVHVVEEKGLQPQIAILADITLRHIGSLSYRPIFSYPTAKIAFAHTLTKKLSFSYNTGFGYNGYNADGFFIYSATLAYSILDKLGIYGEAFGTFDNGNLPNHQIDGGLTWLLKNNLQLDLSVGTGFDQNVDQYFISTGFSWRIPK